MTMFVGPMSAAPERIILDIDQLSVYHGRVPAVRDVSFKATGGQVTLILGPNGAGKTSLLAGLMGSVPSTGSITLMRNGAAWALNGVPLEGRARAGLRLVRDTGDVFYRLSVLDNLRAGAYLRGGGREIGGALDEVLERFPRLRDRLRQPAGTLSGGELRMLSIGRALMGAPDVLLVDEPSTGLSPLVFEETLDLLRQTAATGVAVIIAEQNVIQTQGIADQQLLLETGHVVERGDRGHPLEVNKIIDEYLGRT